MDTLTRLLLFFVGCIGVRLLFVYVAKNVPLTLLPYLGYLAILPSVGLMYLFITNSSKTGFFEGPVWWNDARLVHSIFYGLFAYHAIKQHPNAWIYLLMDVIIATLFFILR